MNIVAGIIRHSLKLLLACFFCLCSQTPKAQTGASEASDYTPTPELKEEQVKSFNQLQEELRQSYAEKTREKIKESPEKREELINYYNKEYRAKMFKLAELYKSGKIDIVKYWQAPPALGTIPGGFSLGWGSIYLGGALSFKTRDGDAEDWNIVGGTGIWNARDGIAISPAIVVDSVVKGASKLSDIFKFQGDLFDRGGLNLKISRNFWRNRCGAGAGIDHIWHWGMNEESKRFLQSPFVAVTCIYPRAPINRFANTFYFTLGAGTKTFQTYDRWTNERKNGVGVFGGFSMRMWQYFTVFFETRRLELNAGFSIAPFRTFPWTFSFAKLNLLTKSAQNSPFVFSGVMFYRF